MKRFSKREVRKAGHILAIDEADEDARASAREKVDYWRAIHAEALSRLLVEAERATEGSPGLLIAGRIKKHETIIDKLRRSDNVSDLNTMYDIAGCRVVVSSLDDLTDVVEKARRSSFCDSVQTKDYIQQPKKDGYRGVHVIYRFDDLECGHTLRGELQIRTEKEHAWATAVEMYDAAVGTRLKFENIDCVPFWFFKRASTLIEQIELGRRVEADAIREVGKDRFAKESFMEVLEILREANNAAFLTGQEPSVTIGDYCLLDFVSVEQLLRVTRLDEQDAVSTYFAAEKASGREHDLVLTRGFSADGLSRLYPNYFGNIGEFIELIEEHADCFF